MIHIFEHEYQTEEQQQKINNYLSNILCSKKKIYARNTEIKTIGLTEATIFLNKYHLQGISNHTLALGLYYNNELIEIMTFGAPRFNKQYDYELHRLCTKTGYTIIGGASKLFKYFVKNYMQPSQSIVSYCNLAKFTGQVYLNIGMTLSHISKPNYIYVNDTGNTLSRYQCMKQNLIEQGYNAELTEQEIMTQRGYYKIYDCGNAVYTYEKQ